MGQSHHLLPHLVQPRLPREINEKLTLRRTVLQDRLHLARLDVGEEALHPEHLVQGCVKLHRPVPYRILEGFHQMQGSLHAIEAIPIQQVQLDAPTDFPNVL